MRLNKKLILSFILIISILFIPIACAPEEDGQEPEDQQTEKDEELGQDTEIPLPEDMILAAEEWQDEYPLIYESLQLTSRYKDGVTEDPELGGSHPIDYLEKYPDIKVLYDGYGFAKEYYAARGHYYAMEDVVNTARPKGGASCLACKTADYEKLVAEYGDDLHSMDFHKVSQEAENGITCYTCHRNEPGEIQTTTFQYNAAVDNLDFEPQPGTESCAQCHIEYYQDPETLEVIVPWENGLEVEDIESYFDERDYHDWKHPRTGTPLIKVQHPEFETYTGSIHDQMGVSCADCHMPTVEENGEEYKSHWAKSPLKTVEESCGSCHGSEIDTLTTRVEDIQKEIDDELLEVGSMLVQLIEDFGSVIENESLDDDTMDKLWDLHRKAQYRWDFVFVENSTGFHHSDKARNTLNDARDYAQQALDILSEYQ